MKKSQTSGLNNSLKREILSTFGQTLADLKSKEDALAFLKDFLTDKELDILGKRLAIAYWLKKGRSYQNIKQNLKVSSATIASVQNLLSTKGLNMAIKNIEAEEWATKWMEKIKKFVR